MFRIRQHFRYLDLTRLHQPTVENFEKQIALKIDKHRFRIFIATFRSAAAQCLFGRTNINNARQIFIEQANRRVRGKIRGKKAEVKIRTTECCAPECVTERFFVRTTPKHAMMKDRDWGMELG